MNPHLSRCNLETGDFKEQACRPKHFQLARRQQDVYRRCQCYVCALFTLKNLEQRVFGPTRSLMECTH